MSYAMALATPFLYCTPSGNMKLHYLVMGDWQKSNTLTLYCLPCNKTKSGAAPLYDLHPHHQNHLLHFTCNKRIVQVWVELRVEWRVGCWCGREILDKRKDSMGRSWGQVALHYSKAAHAVFCRHFFCLQYIFWKDTTVCKYQSILLFWNLIFLL